MEVIVQDLFERRARKIRNIQCDYSIISIIRFDSTRPDPLCLRLQDIPTCTFAQLDFEISPTGGV